jgi:hypothetical protein
MQRPAREATGRRRSSPAWRALRRSAFCLWILVHYSDFSAVTVSKAHESHLEDARTSSTKSFCSAILATRETSSMFPIFFA